MSAYTLTELEALLADLESDLVERKETFRGDAPTKVREAVCAFANDLPGHGRPGVVFIGARDDGTPTGATVTDELQRQLADVKTDGNILPPPSLTVQKHVLCGAEVAVVLVEPSDSPPVRYKGRIHVRVGPRRAVATAQDERILNERRRHADAPFDVQPVPTATLRDLDRRLFESVYLPAAFAPDLLEANDRSYEQRLAATKMIAQAEDPVPTVLGLLVLGVRPRDFLPGTYVQFLRVDGAEHGDPVSDELVVDGAVGDVLRRVDDKLQSHNRTAVEFVGSTTEERREPYPLPALQQLVRNAVLHRTYEATNAPVHVYWFADRIEIQSPGGPFGSVTPENFGAPGIVDYRNPNLAEALHVLGFVQRYGFGIPLARRLLAENGNPEPEFDVRPSTIVCRVRARP